MPDPLIGRWELVFWKCNFCTKPFTLSSPKCESKHPMDEIIRFWIYIVRCADGSYYTGHTDNLEKRLAQHFDRGYGKYVSTRLPISLVFSEEFNTLEEALACERQIKGWSRKKKEALIRGDRAEISKFARKRYVKK
jgi:putative endonuclease